MRKYCLLTIAVGDTYTELAKLTHPTLKAYADRIGADFIVVTESTTTSPHWEKFKTIYSLLNKYERIVYLDTDIIVRDDCPNLFDLVPTGQLGLFNELPFAPSRHLSLVEACKTHNIVLKKWKGTYFNTGVMVVSRQHKFLFKKPELESCNYWEQGYFNAILASVLESDGNELSVFSLPYAFNRMTCMDERTGEERFASYIIHYAGFPNPGFMPSLVSCDLQKWADCRPAYKFKRHIIVDVQGGLGDQACAEPVIRFLRDQVWKDEDIVIVTHFPTLFNHLNLPVYRHGTFQPEFDTPYYHIITLPGPEGPLWSYVSNLMCHTVDFSSIACLKRTLPFSEKHFTFRPEPSGIEEVETLLGGVDPSDWVLVHPGRHWESKTFPIKWWQAVVDGLQEEGKTVCLIGQDCTTRGTVNLQVREGMFDYRNLLTLEGFIALLSKNLTVLSNDSAPVHLAGAFDGNIILIPTCKHPDHILPFRHGSVSYKTAAVYKRLMIEDYDSRPTTVNEIAGDKTPYGNFEKYLPDPLDVVAKVLEIDV